MLRELSRALGTSGPPQGRAALAAWMSSLAETPCRPWDAGGAPQFPAERTRAPEARGAGRTGETAPAAESFARHTYFGQVCRALAGALIAPHARRDAPAGDRDDPSWWADRGLPDFLDGDPYGWCAAAAPGSLTDALAEVTREAALWAERLRAAQRTGGCDPLKPLYEALFPARMRRRSGEFYTPDGLARWTLDESGYRGGMRRRVIDPACGSGTFLALAIRRARSRAGPEADPRATLGALLEAIGGCDLHPSAVQAARVTYLLAVIDLIPPGQEVHLPVRRCDVLLDDPPLRPADYLVGNPPWIRWSLLPERYRQRLWDRWRRYGLLGARGFQARLAPAELDVAMLFLFTCADRLLRTGGRVAFLMPLEALRSKAAGRGFRSFRLGPEGAAMRPLKVHDLGALKPFAAGNKAGLMVLQKGPLARYPVPYHVWDRRAGVPVSRRLEAHPSGPDRDGPWSICGPGDVELLQRLRGPSAYRPRRGLSTDPYGVFHVTPLGPDGPDRLMLANHPERGRTPVPRQRFSCERELVHPAVRGRDIGRWRVKAYGHVLCPNRSTRQADLMSEERFASLHPRAYAYLAGHRELLLKRSTFWAFFGRDTDARSVPSAAGAPRRTVHRPGRPGSTIQTAVAPFYALRDVGPYSHAAWKVAWGRMATRLSAAVLGPGRVAGCSRPVLPLDTTAFIAADSRREAHFLCALLHARSLARALEMVSAHGRGFAAPSAVGGLRLPRWDPEDGRHRELAALSMRCHRLAAAEHLEHLRRLETRIDAVASEVWGIAVSRPAVRAAAGEGLGP